MIPKLLFSPIKVGTTDIKNRIVLPPMVSGHAGPDARVTENHINWYAARAKGGAGMIIIEATSVHPRGSAGPVLLGIWDDSFIPGFRELTKVLHTYGAKVFLQLAHAGRQTTKAFTGGYLPVAPSPLSCPLEERLSHEIPQELLIEEIGEITSQFGMAARRTREAGFDGLEIHGAHGYLISGFMSPYSNKRHDEYGGDLASRMKFPLEVVRSVRREVDGDFPVIFRYSGDEFVPDGRTVDESKRIACMLEAAGVNCLHISAAVYESFWAQIPPYGIKEGLHADTAAAIKHVVNLPVITVGRIKSPEIAEEILEQGKADMVALGRQLICDPDWPTKVSAGDFGEIRPCIGCTQSCINRGIIEGKEAACIYNTSAGMEKEAEIKPAKKCKSVMVIGGGPGGLEAARVAALRGHKVVVFEKADKLGGRLNLACVTPFKQEFALAIKWLSSQVKKLGVQIELGREVTPELVSELAPDVVIVATGAIIRLPDIPGLEKKEVVVAEDLLAGKVCSGTRVAMLGGGAVGSEVADFLAQRGSQVTLITTKPEIGVTTGIPLLVSQLLIPRLIRYGVKIITSAIVQEITDDGIIVDVDGKKETICGIEQIVIAKGYESFTRLADELKGKVPEVYIIGDAKEPRTVFEATREGAEVARSI